jgi:hypothetical protein
VVGISVSHHVSNRYLLYNLKNMYGRYGCESNMHILWYSLESIHPPVRPSVHVRVASTWSIGHPWNASFHFSFLLLRQSVGLLGRVISPSQGRYLHRTIQTQNNCRQTSMSSAGFEPTIPVLERVKTVPVLDRKATAIGEFRIWFQLLITWINYNFLVWIDIPSLKF